MVFSVTYYLKSRNAITQFLLAKNAEVVGTLHNVHDFTW